MKNDIFKSHCFVFIDLFQCFLSVILVEGQHVAHEAAVPMTTDQHCSRLWRRSDYSCGRMFKDVIYTHAVLVRLNVKLQTLV